MLLCSCGGRDERAIAFDLFISVYAEKLPWHFIRRIETGLRMCRCGLRLFRFGGAVAGAGAAELRAADGAALRDLPH